MLRCSLSYLNNLSRVVLHLITRNMYIFWWWETNIYLVDFWNRCFCVGTTYFRIWRPSVTFRDVRTANVCFVYFSCAIWQVILWCARSDGKPGHRWTGRSTAGFLLRYFFASTNLGNHNTTRPLSYSVAAEHMIFLFVFSLEIHRVPSYGSANKIVSESKYCFFYLVSF